ERRRQALQLFRRRREGSRRGLPTVCLVRGICVPEPLHGSGREPWPIGELFVGPLREALNIGRQGLDVPRLRIFEHVASGRIRKLVEGLRAFRIERIYERLGRWLEDRAVDGLSSATSRASAGPRG